VKSAQEETITLQKTKKTQLRNLHLKNIANGAKNTQYTKR